MVVEHLSLFKYLCEKGLFEEAENNRGLRWDEDADWFKIPIGENFTIYLVEGAV